MNSKFSFQRDWSQVKHGDARTVKGKLMRAMNITSRVAWHQRRRGETEPKISEYQEIGQVFAEYGITDVWGDGVESQIEETL